MPISSKEKGKKGKVGKAGATPCGISGCDGGSDKHVGGRSLSQENAIDVWGEGGFSTRKNRVRVCKSCYKLWKKETKDDANSHY